jgi:hypothetical protein
MSWHVTSLMEFLATGTKVMNLNPSEIDSIAALISRCRNLVSDALLIAADRNTADLTRRLKEASIHLEEAETANRRLLNGGGR